MNCKTVAAALAALCAPLVAQAADPAAVARGKYLVTIASCHDCHTPGYFLGKPDMARYLGGSDVGFELPGLGVFHGPNLTPDKATGLGNWTDAQVVAADVPLSEMFGYSTTLRSMTQGRAVYSMQFDHYEEVPKNIAEGIITKQQKG